jgi:hypothetical protein
VSLGATPCLSKNTWGMLEKALQRLDELSVEEFSKFVTNLNIFVIDGSALTANYTGIFPV